MANNEDIISALSITNDLQKLGNQFLFLNRLQRSVDILNQRIRAVAKVRSQSNPLGFEVAGNWVVGKLTAVEIDAESIVSGYIATTRLDILQILVEGLTLTDNSPGAGRVAWSGCSVFYNGIKYTVSSGSTASSSEFFIYWTVGNSTFTSASSFVPAANVFLIATNTNGTSDVAWNKLAMSGVQKDNLVFGLIEGVQIQPIASATRSLTATGTTTLLNVSGFAGGLLNVGVIVNTAPTGTPSLKIQYTIDGSTSQSVDVYVASNVFDTAGFVIATDKVGNGSAIADNLMFQEGIGFSTSCKVDLICSGTGATGVVFGYAKYGIATS